MKLQFETQVTESAQNSASSRSIRFSRPHGFAYLPGQFIILKLKGIEGEIAKPLSLSSSPTEDFLQVTKRLTGHEFSNALLSLRKGDSISFSGPFGNFTFSGEYEKIAMLSGGIGITPLRSMIRFCTDKGLPTDIFLFYSNRQEDDIPFRDEFDDLKAKNSNLTIINTLTRPSPSWKGRVGRIDAKMIKQTLADFSERVFYTSGPRKMVDSMQLVLEEMDIPVNQTRKEYFPGYD
ncbi:MAG: Sulfhydrogenase 2 subunit gamma [Euryarchaeota archaeon]|nr:Sulfhydrogenase 2 subunit gamma [Euryarchaeota archaeon]